MVNSENDLTNTKDELKRLAINQDNKVSYSLFYWIIGLIGTIVSVGIIIISGILNYAFNRIDKIDNKHQSDHDKLIKLETRIDMYKR